MSVSKAKIIVQIVFENSFMWKYKSMSRSVNKRNNLWFLLKVLIKIKFKYTKYMLCFWFSTSLKLDQMKKICRCGGSNISHSGAHVLRESRGFESVQTGTCLLCRKCLFWLLAASTSFLFAFFRLLEQWLSGSLTFSYSIILLNQLFSVSKLA